MYNAELKRQFIQDFSKSASTQVAVATLFNALEPYEVSWNADVCTRSVDEIKPVLQSLVGVRTTSGHHRILILKNYAAWCCSHNVPGANPELSQLTNIIEPQLEKIRSQMVASPAHLQRCLDQICAPVADETVDCAIRGFLWLAFSGVPEEDAEVLPASAVDFSDLIIRYNGMVYPIYREAIPALRACVQLRQFRIPKPQFPKECWPYKDRNEGDWILRRISSADTKRSLRVVLSRRVHPKKADGKISVNLGYSRVLMSGMFYRTYEAELDGKTPDFSVYVRNNFGKNGSNLRSNTANFLTRSSLRDYQNWKAAFYPSGRTSLYV